MLIFQGYDSEGNLIWKFDAWPEHIPEIGEITFVQKPTNKHMSINITTLSAQKGI